MSKQHDPTQQLQKELQRMYVRTEHWISDYDFFEDEFNFFVNLLDKYFIGAVISDIENSKTLQDAAARLMKLDKLRVHIATLNRQNLQYLSNLIQNKELFDPEECRDRQADLESDHVDFMKQYREMKKEIFHLSEKLIKESRSKNLLSK